jgi:Xaa-Pro aminopeptidase
MNFNLRLRKFSKQFLSQSLNGFIISRPENRFYLTGFTGSAGILFLSQAKNYLFVDGRYIEQAQKETSNIKIIPVSSSLKLLEDLADLIISLKIGTVGFEEDFFVYSSFNRLKRHLARIKLVPKTKLVERLRMIKDEDELRKIKDSARIIDATFSHFFNLVKPGISEKDLEIELEYFAKKNGAEKTSFDFIVASGARTSLPHGRATNKTIKKNDLVMFDAGVIFKGYSSDMTRTIKLGKATKEEKNVFESVLDAQKTAISMVKAGVKASVIDENARRIIKKNGFGKNFLHALGHGLGLSVHEGPVLSPESKDFLRTNMVITIEPGIYLSGKFGVRIEDMVLITNSGCEVLTKSPKVLEL